MAKVMRTISDVRDEIRGETLSTQPLLTNDYTYGNIIDRRENLEGALPDQEKLEESQTETEDIKKKENKQCR